MRKRLHDVQPPDLRWDSNVVVQETAGEKADFLATAREVVRRAFARVRQLARFFYSLLTES